MYFVEGIVRIEDSDGNPNGKFFLHLQKIRLQDVEDIVQDVRRGGSLIYTSANYYVVSDICDQVDLISNAEQLPEEDFVNPKRRRCSYTGYIYDYDNAMDASCSLAESTLPKLGFDQNNITESRD